MAQAELVLADREEQFIELRKTEFVCQLFQIDCGLSFALQRLLDLPAAAGKRLLLVDRIEPSAHLGAGARAGRVFGTKPVARWPRAAGRAFCGNDLDRLAVLQ